MRVEKPQRNADLQGFFAEGIVINILRSKIVEFRLRRHQRPRWNSFRIPSGKAEVRDQRPETRGQRPEVKNQRSMISNTA